MVLYAVVVTRAAPPRLGMARPMMILLLALALVGVGAKTRAEAKAERQLRKAKKLQKKARPLTSCAIPPIGKLI